MQALTNTMNNTFAFITIAVSMTLGSCLAQENPAQQNSDYSSTPTVTQESTPQEEALQPYEVTINDLADTPWDNIFTHFSSPGAYNQILNPLSMTLEKGQNLIIHLRSSKGFTCDNTYFQCNTLPGSNRNYITTSNWGGWNNFLRADTPLVQDDLQVSGSLPCFKNRVTSASYYFKNNHSGKTSLIFYYALLDNRSFMTPLFNMKIITVTIK